MSKLIECKNKCPWHIAAGKKPLDCSSIVLVSANGIFLILGRYLENENRVVNGNSMFFMYDNYMWAYLDDLLPSKAN